MVVTLSDNVSITLGSTKDHRNLYFNDPLQPSQYEKKPPQANDQIVLETYPNQNNLV